MKERRQNKRWQISWQAKIKLGGALTFIDCSISDLSFTGFRVALSPELPKDTFIKVDIMLGSDCFLKETEVWMAWHKRKEALNLYGLYFSRIKDADKEKIYRFIREHFPALLYSQWWQETAKPDEGIQDKRIFERFKVQLPLRFIDLNEQKEGKAVTEDISAKGVGFVTAQAIKPGASLEMWLQVPDKGEPLYMRGGVAWSKPQSAASGYRTGINLERANLMGLSRALKTP